MYNRIVDNYLKTRQSFFLFGPRATGKTTWIKTVFPGAVFIDLLDSSVYTRLLSAPERLESLIPPYYKGKVIIDEIQRVPALLNEVHRLIEQKGFSFVLTGSSVRSLRKKGVNLLAGRALTRFFHPLTALELGKDFHLENSLSFGHLPYVFRAEDKKAYLASYISTYLREEVLQEGLTRSIASFSKFLEVASFSQAGVINTSGIARETGLDRKTVETYFQIVEDLLIGTRLPAFTKRARRRLVLGDKFFFFDAGVYRAIRPLGPLDSPEEISGAALETLLLQEFSALNDYFGLGYKAYYWRTSNGTEVDFVFYGENGFIAVEVKRGANIDAARMGGLKLFQKDYPQARCYMACGVARREYHGKIEIWPFKDFVVNLPKILQDRKH
ncbi:MAG: AAA family ATPase [Elusimicrobiota bacterium]|nr:AAA family ATPase [Elusimicrobiota bacterium]